MANGGDVHREAWGSRIGLILAAAGNAIGIGNLLRFPGVAAQNGGGAFMVPYVVCLLLFGLPMMWVAWTIGRYGGRFGHGTTPGMFDKLWNAPIAKYLGVLGVAIPMIFCLYYTYIEAWCLGYSWFSLTEDYVSTEARTVDMGLYLDEFLGTAPTHTYFSGLTPAFVFLLITLALNVFVLYRGVAKGIEILAKIAVPLLFLFCLVLAVRIFTHESEAGGSAFAGLSYLWNPKWSSIAKPEVWIAAAGQIFFTLSIGMGSLECYASYLKENDDIALTGLTTASTNEFVEIIFGSLIAIPAAAVFFGGDADTIKGIAEGGTFKIGMVSMPEVLRSMDLRIFGTIWFLLLFLAAFTSSVAVCQPVMAFLQDEAKLKRGTAAALVGLIWMLGSLPVMFFMKYGVLDEMDFWAGTIGLVVFAMIEVVLFAWIFGISRGWKELHRGADIRVPKVFHWIICTVTPVCLIVIFGFWFYGAIEKDALTPQPKITSGVVDRSSYPGKFQAPPMESPENETEEEKARIDQLRAVIKKATRDERRDLKAWAKIEVAEDGRTLTVLGVRGDPAIEKELTSEVLQEYLTRTGWGYQLPVGDGDGRRLVPSGVSVVLAIETLHTAPYIWLTRAIVVAITLTFLGCIRIIWKGRAEQAVPSAQNGG